MVSRYDQLFARLAARDELAFIPFVMLGDPTFGATEALVDALVAAGADALELGIPFSDPVADGPVIQGAALRALEAGATPAACFATLERIRARHREIPVGLLVYANLVAHGGLDAFYGAAQRGGVDSVLIADVPTAEAAPFTKAALVHDIAPVQIVPPNADEALYRRVAELGRGYSYVLGRAGVTGAEAGMQAPARHLIDGLRTAGAPPPVIGFGISTAEHVRQAKAAGAAGVISGSAIVALATRHGRDLGPVAAFAAQLKAATCA